VTVEEANGRGIKYQLRESNVDDYTEAEYNKRAWALVNGVLDGSELRTFYDRISDRKNGAYAPKTADEKYIFAVGDKFGVNNVLIVSDGRYVSPSIDRVYRINLDSETEIVNVRQYIYECEENPRFAARVDAQEIYGQELIERYERRSYKTYSELRSESRPRNAGSGSGKNKRYYRFEQDGSGDNGEVEQTIKPQLRTNPESDAEFFVR